jgi:cation:H+ antiporter
MIRALCCGGLFLLAAGESIRATSPATILWAAPSILAAALLIAWAAESSQFFIAQGFALAILAWLQTLPEFAVEAVLAWHRQAPYLFANLTGALRLLTGLGWPMIYCAAAVVHRRRSGQPLRRITMHGEHSITIVWLLIPLLYIPVVLLRRSLNIFDGVVLTAIYAAYLFVLSKMPPQDEEGIEDLERIPRAIVLSPRRRRIGFIALFFVAGGLLIYLAAEPFLGSLFSLSSMIGIPTFVFIQWVAPMVSEFPEGLSTFYWARTVHRAPMALMNMVSSNINQWTLLVAVLPVVYSMSAGAPTAIPLDDQQVLEGYMTLGQQLVGMLLLVNMELAWWEAMALFALWFVQFVFSALEGSPSLGRFSGELRLYITIAYFVWAGGEVVRMIVGWRTKSAFVEFRRVWREHVMGPRVD